MQIRHFQPTDALDLLELFTSTIREVNIKDYSSEQVKAWAPENRNLEEWQRSFLGKTVLLAIDDFVILGFGELEKDGHIDRFYVHKNQVGKGVGKFIYEALEVQAVSMGIKRLFVEASITARPFFQKMGFINPREQRVHLRGAEFTNYRMEKFL